MTNPVPSVKERILTQVITNLEEFNVTDNNGVDLNFVTREELTEEQQNQGIAVSVIDGDEVFTYQTGYLLCTLSVGFDIACKLAQGDSGSQRLGAVFAAIKKMLLSDTNLIEDGTNAQLCENIQVKQYLPDKCAPNAAVATAFATFDFIYRENKENPYQLM